jgi:murein L,D-transpeptidase YcbB/YkuD
MPARSRLRSSSVVLASLLLACAAAAPAACAPATPPSSEAGGGAAAPAPPSDPTARALWSTVETGRRGGTSRPALLRPTLEALYGPRGWRPLWLADGRPTAVAHQAIGVLLAAGEKGLDPRDYDAAGLAATAERLAAHPTPVPDERADFDVALSVALVRLLSDVHVGRVNPEDLDFGYDLAAKRLDLARVLSDAVASGRIADAVEQAEPQLPQRPLLEAQLARYRAIAAGPVGPVHLAPTVHPGDACEQAPALARWLRALGDLPADASVAPDRYDGPLVDAVERFQARHGLAVDGVIGRNTAVALAVPASARVRQIELALERLRWVPALPPGRVVFVNVSAFELVAFDAIGPTARPALRMPVVVGRAVRTETPVFAGTMRTVVFGPYWNVPRSITRGEILPKLRKDPGYLASEGMEVVRDGRVLGDGAEAIAAIAAGEGRVRQRPGPKNALGRVKFLFPNAHSVYLHDTPVQSLFQRSRRDFSHGCIRVAQPAALALWVLGDQGWDAARVAEALDARRPRRVAIEHPIPVVIYYATAVAHGDGTISFYDDIYGRDAALERALARRRAASQASQASSPAPLAAETSSTTGSGITCARCARSAATETPGRAGRRSVLVSTTRSAARNITGYLSGLSSPSVTESATTFAAWPRS